MATNNEVIKDELGEDLAQPIPDGVYRCITSAKIVHSKKESRNVPFWDGKKREPTYLIINYGITEGEFAGNDEIRDFFELFPDIPREGKAQLDPDERQAVSRQSRNRVGRMRQLGIPEAQLGTINPALLDSLDVWVTIKSSISQQDKVTRFLNIQNVDLAAAVSEVDFNLSI